VSQIRIPEESGDPVVVLARINDKDGKRQTARGREAGSAAPERVDQLSPLMRKIHDGQDTPFISQLLVFLTGIAPLLLGVTGTVMWLRRRARSEHLRAQRT
jgi:uncharacterized iron-regulated membrane protein